MSRQTLDIDHAQAVATKNGLARQEREVEHVLVVNLIELGAEQHGRELRELDAEHPFWRKYPCDARREVICVRDMGEDVVGDHQIGPHALFGESLGKVQSEETRSEERRVGKEGRSRGA